MKHLKYLFDDTANKLAICFFTLVNSYYVFFKLTYNIHMKEVGLYVSISPNPLLIMWRYLRTRKRKQDYLSNRNDTTSSTFILVRTISSERNVT